MAVTAKQIADQLGISAAAVSLALNNRRGVSEKTRQLVLSTAEALGYDFSKIKFERQRSGTVALVAFNRRRIFATPFFADMLAGVEGALRHAGFSFSLVNYSPFENIHQQIADIARHDMTASSSSQPRCTSRIFCRLHRWTALCCCWTHA